MNVLHTCFFVKELVSCTRTLFLGDVLGDQIVSNWIDRKDSTE